MPDSRSASPPGLITKRSRVSRSPARRAFSIAAPTASNACRPWYCSTSPAEVRATCRLDRSTSATPSRSSSRRTALDKAGCAIPSRCAARPKWSSSARAAKYSSSWVSTSAMPPEYCPSHSL